MGGAPWQGMPQRRGLRAASTTAAAAVTRIVIGAGAIVGAGAVGVASVIATVLAALGPLSVRDGEIDEIGHFDRTNSQLPVTEHVHLGKKFAYAPISTLPICRASAACIAGTRR